jgi:Icc-related predicted phosphoesterase
MPETPITRVAAVGDLHCAKSSGGKLQGLFAEVGQHADVLLLCGDLTQKGHPDEVRVLVRELKAATVPILAVLGNHDYESNEVEAVTNILDEAGVAVLDGETWERGDVGFAGVKGFGGGYGEWSLAPWGEPAMKLFVEEATKESLKLERGLASLRTRKKVALLHYSPIAATVMGEPLEIQPFLGSSRLEEPLDRYHVDVAFHGHAHKGSFEGRTRGGIPVFNVALPLLRDREPDRGFHVLDLRELDAVDGGRARSGANPVSRPL